MGLVGGLGDEEGDYNMDGFDEEEDSESEDECALEAEEAATEDAEEDNGTSASTSPSMKRNRVLTIASKGVTSKYLDLMRDFQMMMPQSRKESKLDARDPLTVINDICELRTCTHSLLFDTRRHRDLYLTFARSPSGPSLRFYVDDVHTMSEMNFTGNCLRGSRALLSFDPAFDTEPRWRLTKQIFTEIFAVPRGHPRSKPFIDHVFMFSIQDGRVWFRNYQIVEQGERRAEDRSLVEIGPRLTLNPVRFFAGSYGGEIIYENIDFVSPNAILRAQKLAAIEKTKKTLERKRMFEESRKKNAYEKTELDDLFK